MGVHIPIHPSLPTPEVIRVAFDMPWMHHYKRISLLRTLLSSMYQNSSWFWRPAMAVDGETVFLANTTKRGKHLLIHAIRRNGVEEMVNAPWTGGGREELQQRLSVFLRERQESRIAANPLTAEVEYLVSARNDPTRQDVESDEAPVVERFRRDRSTLPDLRARPGGGGGDGGLNEPGGPGDDDDDSSAGLADVLAHNVMFCAPSRLFALLDDL